MTTGLTLGAILTVVGLLISFFVWRRKGLAYGLRGVAWSLLPLVAGLLGLMTIIWQAVVGIVGILVGLIFNPLVWAGVALGGLMVVLYVASGFMKAKGIGVKPGARPQDKARARTEGEGTPAAGAAPPAAGQVNAAQPKKAKAPAADDDFGDIEALLRKRGIE
ncbi:hypothetical protein [Nocardiopsis ganjiahuensis]|uniref:hypothetical protein n=1 Tax=Nocardiopsis ganjiahuensis TaxID=239984 RepID=UPI00034D9AB6|nr:hypothetical protein [Nocardiopsis ganjiahuensis]